MRCGFQRRLLVVGERGYRRLENLSWKYICYSCFCTFCLLGLPEFSCIFSRMVAERANRERVQDDVKVHLGIGVWHLVLWVFASKQDNSYMQLLHSLSTGEKD